MFRLTALEWESRLSQIVITYHEKRKKKALQFAFTEQGLAMLSGVLITVKTIEVNTAIMRTFVFLHQLFSCSLLRTIGITLLSHYYHKQTIYVLLYSFTLKMKF